MWIRFFAGPKDLLSDRCILSCPSMDLVTCLLDFRLNFASNRSIVPRLAASLAACAQLSALGMNSVTIVYTVWCYLGLPMRYSRDRKKKAIYFGGWGTN